MSSPGKLTTYLRLGRVSNLPTVWTNTLTGVTLAGATGASKTASFAAILSIFYVAGMFLNDAFDRDIDAKERPDRPIPAGHATAVEVFSIGFGMLGLGVGLLYWMGGFFAAFAGFALAGNIVLYVVWHNKNSLSPVLMGGCRVLVYVTSALAVGRIGWAVLGGASALFAYLIGLTYTAKIEGKSGRRLWPLVFLAVPFLKEARALGSGIVPALVYAVFFCVVAWAVRLVMNDRAVGRAIVLLLSGISLLDALLLAGAGHDMAALVASGGFVATRVLQRWVKGT
jgi:4-hydroxybenzoate polyprenyltransferase